MSRVRSALACCACAALLPACTYGPLEDDVRVEQIVALGDSYRAFVVVRRDQYRQPTGLSAFPDGGKRRFEAREASQYLIDSRARTAVRLTSQEAPDSLWESFSVHVRGLVGDTVAYIAMTGCPRGGECYPALQKTALLRLTTGGDVGSVAEIPGSAELPGVMLARRVGEENYVRYGEDDGRITARFEEEGPYRPIFGVDRLGALRPLPDGAPEAS